MEFYFLQLFLIFVYWIIIGKLRIKKITKTKIFLFFVWTHLFLLEGFRSLDFGADQWYQYLYLQITKIPWSKILRYNDFVNEKSEIGYIVLNKFLSDISKEVQFLYVFVSAIYLSSVCIFFRKYSHFPVISVFIFFVSFWFQSFYILRQYLAIGLCLFSLHYVVSRNLKIFIGIIILAFSMHQTSIVFLPVYFLYNYYLEVNKRNLFLYLLLCILMAYSIGFLMNLAVGNLVGYDSYLDSEIMSDGNLKMAFVYISFFITYAMFTFRRKTTLVENLFFKMLGIAIMLQIAGSQFVLMQRLNLYYAISLLIIIPNTIKHIKSVPFKLAFVIFTIFLFTYIMYQDFEKNRYQVLPYSSILF